VDLDEQIAKTFQACGFPNPQRAESVRELRDLLRGPGGGTILTTVHKFQDLAIKGNRKGKEKTSEFPTLTEARNVFVLTDEAHRTQYGSLAANMRKALPNAAFFGFTGTPIDKKDRSTLRCRQSRQAPHAIGPPWRPTRPRRPMAARPTRLRSLWPPSSKKPWPPTSTSWIGSAARTCRRTCGAS
jgi:type I site-specific restriction-modification system R (restriction) subunit